MNLGASMFLSNSLFVHFMNNRLMLFMYNLFLMFMNDRLMLFMYDSLIYHWLYVFMNNILMFFHNNIFVLLCNSFLVMFVNNFPMRFFNNGFFKFFSNNWCLYFFPNNSFTNYLLEEGFLLMANNSRSWLMSSLDSCLFSWYLCWHESLLLSVDMMVMGCLSLWKDVLLGTCKLCSTLQDRGWSCAKRAALHSWQLLRASHCLCRLGTAHSAELSSLQIGSWKQIGILYECCGLRSCYYLWLSH